jgi:hypothetical protein
MTKCAHCYDGGGVMNHILRITLSFCTLFVCSFAAPAFSGNLVVNPNFNTDISGWANNGGVGSFDGTMDANGSPSSGSAKGSLTLPPFFSTLAIGQCISGITPGTAYDFGGKIRIQSAPGTGSSAFVALTFFTGSACSTGLSPTFFTPIPSVTTTGSWVAANATATAPAGAGSVSIVGDFGIGSTPGTMVVNFDDIFFQVASPGPTIPALSETMLIALALILGGLGAFVLGRTS